MIGHEIRDRRTDQGLTQVELARMVGVTQGRLSEYERGTTTPSLEILRSLAEVLGPFEVSGGVRTLEFYERTIKTFDSVGTSYLARGVYASLFGNADDPDRESLRQIARGLFDRFGESVSSVDALEVLRGEHEG